MLTTVLMLSPLVTAAAEKVSDAGVDLNSVVSGGVGVSGAGALLFIVKLIIDRTLPGRSDQRANVQIMLESLNNMIKVLQEEKIADAKRLEDKQTRIDALESEAERDYDRISELRGEIIDLRQRLAVKDRHINALVSQLRRLGILVSGIELDDPKEADIKFSSEEVKETLDSASDKTP
jgi:chaperonin cofactor prefoldin